MPRPPRIQYPDAHYHVCARGNERRRIFWHDDDYRRFCDLLAEMCAKYDVRMYAFVLMTNHVHLMMTTPQGNLALAMQWLKTSYSVWINRKRGRTGHLFQGRYHSVLVEDESHYLELSRYIHLNPVRAGMLRFPEDYPWSSFSEYVMRRRTWPWLDRDVLLHELGGSDRRRHQRYRAFVHAGIRLDDEALQKYRRGRVLGGEGFVDRIIEKFGGDDVSSAHGKIVVRAVQVPIDEMVNRINVEVAKKLPANEGHKGTIMYLLHRLGYRLDEIAKRYGVSYSAVSQNARRYGANNPNKPALEALMSNVKV